MKRYFLHLLGCLLLIVLVTSCNGDGQKGSATSDNPVFNRPEIKGLTDAIANDPVNAERYAERAAMLHRMNEDSLAIDDYKKAASLDSTKSSYYSAIGNILFDHKDVTGSAKWIQKAIKLNPADPIAHMKFAKMLLYLNDYKKAMGEINFVLRQNPFDPEGYFLKGMIYKELKDTSKAISSFQSSINVAPDYKDAMVQLGLLYADKRDSVALKYYDNAFHTDTTDVFPLYAKAVFYNDNDKIEKAKELYKDCIIRDHQYANAYYNLGEIYNSQDSVEKALRQYDLITKISPNDAEAYYRRGLCYLRLGKKAQAKSDFQQALVFDENYKEAKDELNRLSK